MQSFSVEDNTSLSAFGLTILLSFKLLYNTIDLIVKFVFLSSFYKIVVVSFEMVFCNHQKIKLSSRAHMNIT